MSNILAKVLDRVDEAKAKAKAEGFVDKDGTYTFTSREASLVNMCLRITQSIVQGELGLALALTVPLTQHAEEVNSVIDRIAGNIVETQMPAYINEAIDTTLKEENATRKDIS